MTAIDGLLLEVIRPFFAPGREPACRLPPLARRNRRLRATAALVEARADRPWLDQVTATIRWLAWRRRAYGAGEADLWPHEACYRWASYAGEAAAGRPLDEQAIALAVSEEAVLLAAEPEDEPPFKPGSHRPPAGPR